MTKVCFPIEIVSLEELHSIKKVGVKIRRREVLMYFIRLCVLHFSTNVVTLIIIIIVLIEEYRRSLDATHFTSNVI